MNKLMKGVAGVAIVAALPTAFATVPAEAATPSNNHCAVYPQRPVSKGRANDFRVQVINYRIRVTCDAAHTIQIEQRVFEDDDHPIFGSDRILARRTVTQVFRQAGQVFINGTMELPNTEDSKEEMYHDVRFVVTGQAGGWTGRVESANGSFAH